jgi:hypothetical protein
MFLLNYYMSVYIFSCFLKFLLHFPNFGSFLSSFAFSLWLYIHSFPSYGIFYFLTYLSFTVAGNGKKGISCETTCSYSWFLFSTYGLPWVVTFFHLMTNRHSLFTLI